MNSRRFMCVTELCILELERISWTIRTMRIAGRDRIQPAAAGDDPDALSRVLWN